MGGGRMISIVIPVYNNGDTVEELSRLIDAVLASQPHETIFVNDGSSDDSSDRLRAIARGNAHVKVLFLSRNFGQHPAISAGFEAATGDYIVLMDADLQDRPQDIPMLIRKLSGDVDVVYTIKKDPHNGFPGRLSSLFYHYMFSKIVGARVPPNIGTLRAFTRKVLNALLLYRERNILYGPLMFYMGFQCEFVEVLHDERKSGRSSYSFKKRFLLAVNSFISYTDIPHRVSIYTGMVLFLGSFIYGLAVLVEYLLHGRDLPAGLTLIVLVLTIMLGSLMISLGIIGSYLFRVYQEVLDRPRYLITEKINC